MLESLLLLKIKEIFNWLVFFNVLNILIHVFTVALVDSFVI